MAAGLVLALVAAAASAQGTAYVSSEKDDALTLIDTQTLTVKGSVPTCKRGRHIQRLPDGKLMVACTDSNAADVIDPATGKSVRRVPLGEQPEAFDISPDGKTIYVSNEDEAEASFVDAASGKVLKSVKVGQEPEGVKVSADGKTLYVTSEVASMIHVIDVASAKVLKNVKVGKRPRRMAITPDGRELWVTNELGSSVSIISTADHSVVGEIKFAVKGARAEDISPVGITMTRDGKRAFVALGRANHVAFVDVAARKVTDLVLVGKRAWNVTLDKAEQRLWVVNGLSDDVTVVDVAAAKAIKSIPVGRVPYGVAIVE
ncbi:MAG: PQQ-dependent catabolism-associated beta-propeller protein [Piscinibacter sp.]|uniref:PQQ-dependent catabolism-associated beta-propeller protein n=1 Tax=Piscinibacter sp. TaxID=1903157 RepID=UPI001B42C72E|nr:PQQ-dependent catabolism-associated beta-propeller protein [Piscinibacter sp.]MBP5988936.1 PQQ-dependent catabolism-associated beta-propeller protein [Piscinibacter sp.]MBP6026344.1 PQQ-dependent catabolism-associated beta-propeller protein [Piscinibacter sp.]